MFNRILIPSDGSASSEEAVRRGLSLAKALDASVTFLHAVDDPFLGYSPAGMEANPDVYPDLKRAGEAELGRLAELAEAMGVSARTALVEHIRPADAIHAAEGEHDLVVMGTHGRRGFNRLVFGSVAEVALRRSETPYLMVRSPGTQTKEAKAEDASKAA